MGGKSPSFQFYVKDWLSDLQLRKCQPSTRGIWMDLLCYMWWDGCPGKISATPEELGRMTGSNNGELETFFLDAEKHKFCDVILPQNVTCNADVTKCNIEVTIINRRMYREEKLRENTRLRVQRHRGKKGSNEKVTLHPPSPSPSPLDLSKDKSAEADLSSPSKHYSNKAKNRLEEIDSLCKQVTALPVKPKYKFNVYQWVQWAANNHGHPNSILTCLTQLHGYWDNIRKGPWEYITRIFQTVNPEEWQREREHDAEMEQSEWHVLIAKLKAVNG